MQLLSQHQRVQVTGIGGPEYTLSLCSMVTLTVANQKSLDVSRLSKPQLKVEVAVLSKITAKFPVSPVSIDRNWRHLSDLRLADPEFGVPGNIDVLRCRHVQLSSTLWPGARFSWLSHCHKACFGGHA